MSNFKVSALNLRDLSATPLCCDDDPISLNRLNYVWVGVRDILTGIETKLRFLVADRRLLLRGALPLPRVVEEIEADLRRVLVDDPGQFQWLATMIHCPIAGLGQIDSSAIALGDNLQVDALGDWEEFWVRPKVNFGEVTEILVVAA